MLINKCFIFCGFTRSNLPGEDEHNSLKKIYYFKNVSDLYKSMNFLKKKRNEKLKQKSNFKKNEKKDKQEKEKEMKKRKKKKIKMKKEYQ